MTALLQPDIDSTASAVARANWHANLSALGSTQAHLGARLQTIEPLIQWVWSRDRSLSGQLDGAWIGDCSVPRAAAREMLIKLDPAKGPACFLKPMHGQFVVHALEKLSVGQAILLIEPELQQLSIVLHCVDLSGEIKRHRLWIAAGESWAAELNSILSDHPGLPLPQQFIKLPVLPEEEAAPLIAGAQEVFSMQAKRHSALLADLKASWKRVDHLRIAAVVPSRFRLWDQPAGTLAHALSRLETSFTQLDPDDPATSSPLALAKLASNCDFLCVANSTRAELAAFIPAEVALISWITVPRVPPFKQATDRDILLFADPAWVAQACQAGWPSDRVHLAQWPPRVASTQRGSHLAVICDTRPIERNEGSFELSSHWLLWETIRSDLTANPLALGDDPADFLGRHFRQLNIPQAGLDHATIFQGLIFPAFTQGLVRWLIDAGLPVRLYGSGWENLPEFASQAAGAIESDARLSAAAEQAAALVHVWPGKAAHPIDALGRPVVRASTSKDWFLRNAKRSLTENSPLPLCDTPLSSNLLQRIIEQVSSH